MSQEKQLTKPFDRMEALVSSLAEFAKARDWDQFHSPKNLTMALAAEVGELVELFQWVTEEESHHLSELELSKVADEIGDIQIYLARLGGKLGIDTLQAAFSKIENNEKRYPVSKAKGNARKYPELDQC